MRVPALFFLTAWLLGSFGWCATKFIAPPEWSEDDRNRWNLRFAVGDNIPLDWETDLLANEYRLLIFQRVGSSFAHWKLDNSRTSWEAEYRGRNGMEDGEDSVYYFTLSDSDVTKSLADSVYFNVTAPRNEETKTVTAPPSTVTISQSRLIQTETASTTIGTATEEMVLPTKQQESESKSGMSQGGVAGAAVGGVIGGSLIFGAIGWVLWGRLVRRKSDPVDTAAIRHQEEAVATKAELPGDNRVHPSEYAKSPTGIYEAP